MSSTFDTIRPPEIAPNIKTTQSNISADEKRSIIPEKQINRQLFEKLANLINRYSYDPLAKDTEGNFIMPDQYVKEYLAAEIEELLTRDALTCLLLALKKEKNLNERFLKVGSYRLVFPTLRQLNNLYLGPIQTNDFLADMHHAMKENLTKHNAIILHTHSKGGSFLIDFTNGAPVPEEIPMNNMESKLANVEISARQILNNHITTRLEHLYRKINNENGQEILENILRLTDLQQQLETGLKSVQIALGFESVRSTDPNQCFWAIRNSECAANMATLDLNESQTALNNGSNNNVIAKQYSVEQLMIHLVKAVKDLGKILNENGEVREEWEDFFVINPDTGYINMKREMIEKYRKKDTFYASDTYTSMSESEKQKFNEKIEIFKKYYNTINLVDIIKEFTAENFNQYLAAAEERATLITKALPELSAETPVSAETRAILSTISAKLEISLKDTGNNKIGTTRQFIRQLISANDALIIICDHIGFGGFNQSSYENSVTTLIDLLDISPEEWAIANGDTSALEKLVKEKTAIKKNDPTFQHAIMSIGDAGTKKIRRNEKKLQNIFGGQAFINADGGDETSVLYKKSAGCEFPDNQSELEKKLLEISVSSKIRIAAVFGDLSFEKIQGGPNSKIITPVIREQILRYIRALQTCEEAHSSIKALNARGQIAVLSYPISNI
jgi:hypothetical protein